MSWATIATRKAELKNRINNLESQDIEIGQKLQTIAKEASNKQQEIQLESNYQQTLYQQEYQTAIDAINNDNKASDTDKQEAFAKVQQKYNNNVSLFQQEEQAKLNSMRNLSDAETNALEAQKEEIETQLKVAKSEYDSLDEAIKDDIKRSTISLA